MTADRQWLALDWGFTAKTTDEVAHTGVNFSLDQLPYTDAASDLDDVNIAVTGTAMITAMNTLMGSGGAQWAGYSELRTFRISAVGTNGLEIGDAKLWEDVAPFPTGTVSNVNPQVTVVCSMRSGQTTGAANFGRMYLPHTQLALTNGEPRASSAVAAGLAASFKTFLLDVGTILNADIITNPTLKPFIITMRTGFASKLVTQLSVGRVNDTQRRRRNKLPEDPSFVAFP